MQRPVLALRAHLGPPVRTLQRRLIRANVMQTSFGTVSFVPLALRMLVRRQELPRRRRVPAKRDTSWPRAESAPLARWELSAVALEPRNLYPDTFM